jgi:hypothetical protein
MRFRFSWPVRAASPIAGNLTRLGKVKLNLDCWIFYQEGYVNIDRNEVRADRYEDISTLPASKPTAPMRFTADTWLSMWTTSKRVSGVGLRC